MTYFNQKQPAPAYSPLHNRLGQRVEQYLNTLGNWNTYRAARQPADILHTVVQVTAAFFGLNTDGSRLTGATILGAIMALHTLERLTASLGTLAIRLTARGQRVGQHRGVALRASSLTTRTSGALRWLLGSRLQQTAGYFFHAGGCTWHYQVLALRLWGETRLLAYLRSLSLPHRSHFFDRDITWQAAIEIGLGERLPERLLGHLGSINELEHAAGLPARAKLAWIAATWLLVDPDERTAQQAPLPSGPSAPPYRSSWSAPSSKGSGTSYPAAPPASSVLQLPPTPTAPSATNGPAPPPPPPSGPEAWVTDRYTLHGRSYPLLVRNIVINPITQRRKADALFFDADSRRWRTVDNETDQIALAGEVAAGRLRVRPDWQAYL
ncbi:MAG: hypothetical protein Kow0031_26230 [Anaerolineae bacterium]